MGRSLWKEKAVPYCLYRSTITYYREGDLAKLEKTHYIIGRCPTLHSCTSYHSRDGLEHILGESFEREIELRKEDEKIR